MWRYSEGRDLVALMDIGTVIDRTLEFPFRDFDTLEQTDHLRHVLIRCLEVMAEAVKRFSRALRDQPSDLPWLRMAGLLAVQST